MMGLKRNNLVCRLGTVFISILIAGWMTSCSWTDTGGTHHLIVGIGFGIITTTNRPGVDVQASRILGAEIAPGTVGVGWMEHHYTAIDPVLASNVVISTKGRGVNITIKNFDPYSVNPNVSYQLIPTNQTNHVQGP
jgi:hypothetical protein